MDRATVSGTVCRGFESLLVRFFYAKFWVAAGKGDAAIEEQQSDCQKNYEEEPLKNLLILFRCAKRSILPSKAETSQKRMRSFYGQNSAAQSHKIQ